MVLLHVYKLGRAYGRMISEDYEVAINPIHEQLKRFEQCGLLKRREGFGRTVWFSFDETSELTEPIRQLIGTVEPYLTKHERELYRRRQTELEAST